MNKHTASIIMLCLLVMGCSFGDKKNSKTEVPVADAVPRFVSYRVNKIDELLGPCASDTTTRKCLTLQLEYPEITGMVSNEIVQKLNENIRRDILGSTFLSDQPTSFEELKTSMEADYSSLLEEFPEYSNPWALEVNSDILYQDSLFISVASTIYSYMGGAHPNSGQLYRSYDLRTGEPIRLSDILTEGYEATLNEAAEIEFRMTREIPPNESLKEKGYWFEEGKFALNENFAIINKSLIFYFNPYEIAPYALGPTELELKLTDFVRLIKEGSVIESYKTTN